MQFINQHTPGPVVYDKNRLNANKSSYPDWVRGTIRSQDKEDKESGWVLATIEDSPNPEKDAELLAASYSALDKAGRELRIDATELAKNLDLTAILRALATSATLFEDSRATLKDAGLKSWVKEFAQQAEELRKVLKAAQIAGGKD